MMSRSARRKGKFVAAAASVLLTLAAGSVQASTYAVAGDDDKGVPSGGWFQATPPPPGYGSWSAAMGEQQILDTLADRILETVPEKGSGYGSVAIDLQNHRIKLYWKGALPQDVQGIIAGAPERVLVSSASYTREEMLAAAELVMQHRDDQSTHIVSAGPTADASGLSIGVTGSVEQGRGLDVVKSLGMQVSVKPDRPVDTGEAPGEPVPQSVSPQLNSTVLERRTDSNPNWGGAWTNSKGNGCTAGFPLHDASGHSLMLTAAHCLEGTPVGDLPDVDVHVGKVSKNFIKAKWDSRDLAVIDLRNQTSSAARMWFGAATGSTDLTYMTVRGVGGNHVNDYVCTNGAYSGTRCGIIVDAVDLLVSHAYSGVLHQAVEAHSWDGSNAAGQGDSGSGVFTLDSDLQGVRARGIQSALSSWPHEYVTCTGLTTMGGGTKSRYCSNHIYYTTISASQGHNWGLVTTAP
ncbi:trypsin-like serine protease [Streptomyces sp. NPDC058701]|uniref:trypsin-like serine protease n=1 Tax=Streptomyces sp. NPDC058701 TaxID=3346608 RepID=UPI003655B722